MRHNSLLLAVVLCLFTATANAATITRLAPDSFRLGNIEEFLTIYGSELKGTESVLVTISGPAGTYVLEPNVVEPDYLITWIPEVVLLTEGQYSVRVAVKNIGEAAQNLGPLGFAVEDTPVYGPPLLDLPEYLTADAASIRGAVVFFQVSAISQNGNAAEVTCDRQPGDLFGFGTTLVTCSAADEFGTSTGSFEIFVGDFTPPVLTLPADFASPTPVVEYQVSAVDNIDGPVPVTCTHPSGSTFPSGEVEVICTAYDSQFNPAVGAFKVTVSGGAPVLALPSDITAGATSAAGAVVTFQVTATDNAVVACTPASGSTFAIGTTAVVCTATNAAGSATGSFNVTVADDNGPVLNVPNAVTSEASSAAGAVVTWNATATDAVDGARPVTCEPASGSTFALGVTLVTCTASDLSGHESSKSFEVTVLDTTAPQIINAAVSPDTLWPPNHQMVPVTVTIVANDLVDPAPIAQIVSIRSNQPLNGTGDGDTAPDWTITGALTAELRSERAGNADRTYTITIEVRDAAGNAATSEVTVRVTQSSRRRSVR